jgi:hypothetical protein
MARYDPLPYVRPARVRNLRLADLYLRQGDQQAESERRRGEIQAQLWSNVGNVVGQTGSAIVQAPQQERDRQAKEAADAQIAESRGLQLGEQRRAVNDRENLDLAMGAGSRQKTLAALKDRPELYEKAQAHFSNIDTSMKKLLGDTAAGIADFGYTPEAAMAAMDDLLDQGFDEKKIEPFRAAIQQNPEAVKTIVQSLLSQSPDPRHQAMAKPQPLVELNKDTSLYDPNTRTTVASGPVSPPPREPNPTEASLAAAAAGGDPTKALAILKGQRPTPASAATTALPEVQAPDDPDSQDIMSQAGLSYQGFLAATGDLSKLGRDRVTRARATAEVQAWARSRGIDVSTLSSQFKASNEVLKRNIMRYNKTLMAEGEIIGDVDNLMTAAKESKLGDARAINAAKLWLNGELNDPSAATYALHLNQLRNDLALYNSASRDGSGEVFVSDMKEAENVIRQGIASGSLTGLQTAINRSVEKMGGVLETGVNRARKDVWNLFGVGDKFKPVNRSGGGNQSDAQPGDIEYDMNGKPITKGKPK